MNAKLEALLCEALLRAVIIPSVAMTLGAGGTWLWLLLS